MKTIDTLLFYLCIIYMVIPLAAQKKSNPKIEVLLIGTSHWNNYKKKGLDVAQTSEVDILSENYQTQLAVLAEKIKAFGPDKIFVERPMDHQHKLDSLYHLYTTTDWGLDKRNEIYQLGFRVAKIMGHSKVYGVDYRKTEFPFDSLAAIVSQQKKTDVLDAMMEDIKHFEKEYNTFIAQNPPLEELLAYHNTPENRKLNLGWYLQKANKAGGLNNNVGAHLTSEWFRRNIHIYGIMQKYTEPTDKKIMLVMGAGHVAIIETLIRYNPDWKVVELEQLLSAGSDFKKESYFVALYTLGERWDTSKPPSKQVYFGAHSAFLSKLRSEKQIIVGARYSDTGMIILKSESLEKAKETLHADLAIKNKLFQIEIHPFNAFYGGKID
ncbi:MAG: DUF5694 domain-containing protein [Bacteroidota bacterium]